MCRQPLSLDQPVGDHEDNFFGEFLQEDRDDDPLCDTNSEMLKQRLDDVMNDLTYREREIIRLRYGLADGYTYTLEEVGKIFSGDPRTRAADRIEGGPQTPAAVPHPGIGRLSGRRRNPGRIINQGVATNPLAA